MYTSTDVVIGVLSIIGFVLIWGSMLFSIYLSVTEKEDNND